MSVDHPRDEESRGRPLRRHRNVGAWALGASGVFVALLMMLPGSWGASVNTYPVSHVAITSGGVAYAPARFVNCTSGVSGNVGYICFSARANGTSAYARGWQQVVGNSSKVSTLSGVHSIYARDHLNLSAGFAHLSLSCTSGSYDYARIYIFWHVWVFDRNLNSYVTEAPSGYIWDSGDISCPVSSGSVSVGSPAIRGAFNSSSTVPWTTISYDFVAGHHYVFTSFVGCTAEVYISSAHKSTAVAGCNTMTNPSGNTFTIGAVAIV